jgi:hypothetical protein
VVSEDGMQQAVAQILWETLDAVTLPPGG